MRIIGWMMFIVTTASVGQIPVPQINLTGNLGCQGFPCVNSGTLNMASDANRTMTAQETSAFYVKVTSSVSLTSTRNLIAPTGKFPFTIENSTTGGQAIQIIGSSGTGVTIPNGQTITAWNDGTNFVGTGIGITPSNVLVSNPAGSQGTTQPVGTVFSVATSSSDGTSATVMYGPAALSPGITSTATAIRGGYVLLPKIPSRITSSTYTIFTTDIAAGQGALLYVFDASSNNISVSLPTLAGNATSTTFFLILSRDDTTNAGNTVTINAHSGNTIGGASSVTLPNFGSYFIELGSSNAGGMANDWLITSSYIPGFTGTKTGGTCSLILVNGIVTGSTGTC